MTTRFHQVSPINGRWQGRSAALTPSLNHMFQGLDHVLRSQAEQLSGAARGNAFGSYNPADLYETNDSVVLEMVVPGVKANDLDINIEGRKLTIKGSSQRNEAEDEEGAERRYWQKDITLGEFERTVRVPAGVDANGIDAHLEDGVLRVTMPKAPEALSRKIAVAGSNESGSND